MTCGFIQNEDFNFSSILPKLSEFMEFKMVSVLPYSPWAVTEFRRCAGFLFIYDFSFNVQIKYAFTLELRFSEYICLWWAL